MELALLGATGAVGPEVLSQAVAAGHLVTAVVRNPAKLPAHVGVVRQDLANPTNEVLAEALRDAEAVISDATDFATWAADHAESFRGMAA